MKKLKLKKGIKLLILIVSIFIIGVIILLCSYFYLSSPVDKKNMTNVQITIENGTSQKNIAKTLKESNLIKSEFLFNIIAKLKNRTLKAAIYKLNRSMSLNEVLDILSDGNKYNPDVIRITFLEGESIKKYINNIINSTNNSYEDVMNVIEDETYIRSLIDKYWFLTDEILNPNIYISLEGYLAPNTYEFKNKEVDVKTIIETMLDQTEIELEPYKNKNINNYTVHQHLTIASILELEGIKYNDRQMIAGVFNNRLANGMNLGSDVTTYYALQKEMSSDLTANEFKTDNPYNTRSTNMIGKLPIGPICNSSPSSIKASFNPKTHDYLFFVADKNGNIYYTKTEKEHAQKVIEIKEAGNWIW